MPRGQYDRTAFRKAQPVQQKVPPTIEEGSAIDLGPDAALAVYKDKSGKGLGGMGSEGKYHMGTIASEAAKVLVAPETPVSQQSSDTVPHGTTDSVGSGG